MVYLAAKLKDGRHDRIHAPGFENPDDAAAAFVKREGIFADEWVRLDVRGEARYLRYDEVAEVRGNRGESHIA
jgi:hypothetical protein